VRGSYLPGMDREMTAHLFPWMACAARIARSSSSVNGPRLTIGLSWLHHLRREGGGGGARGLSDEVERGQSIGDRKRARGEVDGARTIGRRASLSGTLVSSLDRPRQGREASGIAEGGGSLTSGGSSCSSDRAEPRR